MIAFDIFYCIIILVVIAIIIYLYFKLKEPIINIINGIKSVIKFFEQFSIIKNNLENTVKQLNAAQKDISSIKTKINKINDILIINKVNNKQTVAKTNNNKR